MPDVSGAINLKVPGAIPQSEALRWMENIKHNFDVGGEIPSLPRETQNTITARLVGVETRLNELFLSAIPKDRKDIAPRVKFLPTPEFFEQAILAEEELSDDPRRVLDVMVHTIGIAGMRSRDGKQVFVQTTMYRENHEPRITTPEEAYFTGRHEMTHGKVEPKVTHLTTTRDERRTGCKVIVSENGQDVSVKHDALYEAQTDALAIIGAHPEAKSWNDIFDIFLKEHPENMSNDHGFQLSALTRLMDYAFPDYFEGVTAVGESYFRSDGERFFSFLSQKMQKKGSPAVLQEYQQFLRSSEIGDAQGMTFSVTRLLNLAKPDV